MNDRAAPRVRMNAFLLPRTGSPAVLALLLGMPALILLFGLETALEYRREAVLGGEWFRLLSSSFAHLTPGHALLNMGAAALLWLYAGNMPARVWCFGVVFCSLGVGAGLLVFNPEISWYVGMSGLLHGLVPPIVAFRLLQRADRFALLLAVGLALKICAEQLWGGAPGTARLAGGAVIVDAHLWGALSGVLLCLPLLLSPAPRRGENKNSP